MCGTSWDVVTRPSDWQPDTPVFFVCTRRSSFMAGVTMTYNGQQYKLPAVIVLPHGFPREAPIVRMTPRAGMVRNERSSCVDGSLRVVGGYIEKWEYPFSSLGRLYADMKEAFGKSPPLRQQDGRGSGQRRRRIHEEEGKARAGDAVA